MATSISGNELGESEACLSWATRMWGQTALRITGDDATGTTIAPGFAGTNYLIEQNEASPTVDASVTLEQPIGGLSAGTIYETWIYARSVNGDPIDFQWFVGGVARGAATTFSGTEWRSIQLAGLQVTYIDKILNRDVTLRTSGGLVRMANIFFLGRAIGYAAEDYLDSADGAALQTDGDAEGGSSVLMDKNATTGTIHRFLDGMTWPTGSRIRHPVFRTQARSTWMPGTQAGATFNPYISDYDYINEFYRNGVAAGGAGPRQQSHRPFYPIWAMWFDAQGVSGAQNPNTRLTDANGVIFSPFSASDFEYSPGDSIGIRVRAQFAKARAWVDQFWFCGVLEDPEVTSPGGPFVATDTITTPFTHLNNTIPTDYEGLILDVDSATVALGPSTVTYGSDYVVSASSLYTGNFRVVILANYDDGSYSFDSYDFSAVVDAGVGQIYRRY